MNHGIVLSLCDRTANMVKPWARAGYECWCIDLQHVGDVTTAHGAGSIRYIGADILKWLPLLEIYRIAFAFPSCTNLAVSGARWFRSKGLRGLIDGLQLVERCREICEWTGAPWMLENPVSTLSTYWREPDCIFNPCDYGGYLEPAGDAYTKKTCLWTGGAFIMPEKRPVQPVEGSKIHLMPPSDDRGDLRSITPMGFAEAVFQANHQVMVKECA